MHINLLQKYGLRFNSEIIVDVFLFTAWLLGIICLFFFSPSTLLKSQTDDEKFSNRSVFSKA